MLLGYASYSGTFTCYCEQLPLSLGQVPNLFYNLRGTILNYGDMLLCGLIFLMSSADCRNVYLELFSTDKTYRHLLSTESGCNLEFNCAKVIQRCCYIPVLICKLTRFHK